MGGTGYLALGGKDADDSWGVHASNHTEVLSCAKACLRPSSVSRETLEGLAIGMSFSSQPYANYGDESGDVEDDAKKRGHRMRSKTRKRTCWHLSTMCASRSV